MFNIRCFLLGHQYARLGASDRIVSPNEPDIVQKVTFYFSCIECCHHVTKVVKFLKEIDFIHPVIGD